jgi:hypothetical protein
VLVLDMIEILPPLEKYKYDTLRILPVKYYINNFVCLRCYIQNVNSADGVGRTGRGRLVLMPFVVVGGNGRRPRVAERTQKVTRDLACAWGSERRQGLASRGVTPVEFTAASATTEWSALRIGENFPARWASPREKVDAGWAITGVRGCGSKVDWSG